MESMSAGGCARGPPGLGRPGPLEKMAAAELHALVAHRSGLPDLSFGEKRNVGGENADDSDAHAVEPNCFADDGRVGAEGMCPDAVTEDGHLGKIELFV